jgi:hypothetical protein
MFRVMTWNVENLFRPHTDAGPTSQTVYEAKLQGLATKVNAQAPAVLALAWPIWRRLSRYFRGRRSPGR